MTILEADIIAEGNRVDCKHSYIIYVDDGFPHGQNWWCDLPRCGHYEGTAHYEPGAKIRFPPFAFIRTSNPTFGSEEIYSHRANENGIVMELLPEDQRLRRSELESLL